MRSFIALVALASCSKQTPRPLDDAAAKAIVAAADRTDRDRALDKHRKPVELLVFAGIAPGMHVADLGAGTGYTTELVARAVGANGHVIAQDSPNWDGPGLRNAWQARLARPALANTTHLLRDWNDPLPADAHDLDVVMFVIAYHDIIAEHGDPMKLDAAVFAALKPGGAFVVIDSSAKPGTGTSACDPLHRIDEQVVRDQVTRAGFELAGEASFYRDPTDPRDWNSDPSAKDPRAYTQDRFVLKFVKPR